MAIGKLIQAQTLKQDAQRRMQISGLRIQRRINVYETSTLRKGACAQQQKPQERMAGSQKQVKELTKTMPKQGDGQQGRTARSQGDEEHQEMTLQKMALEEQLGELKQAFQAQQIEQLRSKHHVIWQAQQLEELKQQQQRQAPMMSGSSNDVRQQRCLAATTSGSSSDGRQQLDYLLHHPPQAQHGAWSCAETSRRLIWDRRPRRVSLRPRERYRSRWHQIATACGVLRAGWRSWLAALSMPTSSGSPAPTIALRTLKP